jgi:hypothetical protein
MIQQQYVIKLGHNLLKSKYRIFFENIKFLFFRNTRFEQYLQNIDHSLDFVNEALTSGRLNDRKFANTDD